MKKYKFLLDGIEIEHDNFKSKTMGVDLKGRMIKFPVDKNDIRVSELEFCNDAAKDIINWVNSSKETKRKTITMIKDYYKQIGIDRISRLSSLHGDIIEEQYNMLVNTEEAGYKARYTFKFKALEALLGLISWNIDITRFLFIELMGFKE